MGIRVLLAMGGRAVLSAALVLTVCEVVAAAPAHADEEVILQTPPVSLGSGTITVTQNTELSDPITITNPGSTLAVEQQCTNGVSTGSFCLGTTDSIYAQGGNVPLDWEPVIMSGVPSSPFRLPGNAMDWIVDEAEAYVAVTKGLDSIDLVRTYARADIRAYVYARLQDILNKKLYGEPMNEQEVAAYKELQAIRKDRLVKSSKWALEEYSKWQSDPCSYVAPSPPAGSSLPAHPNPASQSTLCSNAGGRFSIWQITDGTPSADTFDRWAAYRHPTPAMEVTGSTAYSFALTQSASAIALGVSYLAAAGIGVAIILATSGMSALAATVVAAALGWNSVSLIAGIGVAMAFAVAGIVVVFIGALITLGIAIWQMVEDAKPGTDLRDRAARAAADDDALDLESSMADYAGLDYATAEDPAEASKKTYIHKDAFQQELFLMVHDWMMFRQDGVFIPDPTTGFNPTGATTPFDVHFGQNGAPRETLSVVAPPDTRNAAGQLLSGYRVRISRGFLMVSDFVTGESDFRPYEPRTSLKFIDAQGRPTLMSMVRIGQEGGPPIRKFVFTSLAAGGDPVHGGGTSWTYVQSPGVLNTVTLLEELPVTPQVNVIPSVQGDLVADHVVNLKANPSDPAFTKTGGNYNWMKKFL